MSGYVNFVVNMRRLYLRYANSLNRVSQWADLPPTADRLIDAINSDLKSVGWAAEDLHVAEHRDHPTDFSAAQCWGHAYVLEGSAVGASMMIKSAQSQLPSTATTNYLQLSGSHAKQRWPLFVKALEAVAEDLQPTAISNPASTEFSQGDFDAGGESSLDPAQQAVAAANEVFAYALQLFSDGDVTAE